ncbi:hypothetical protein [Streptomyces sioyaensis]|uniref:hypothetical protein n=1 Tax=Streptomyces sioyaensis TaxID=67364 RepID=UPI00372441F0
MRTRLRSSLVRTAAITAVAGGAVIAPTASAMADDATPAPKSSASSPEAQAKAEADAKAKAKGNAGANSEASAKAEAEAKAKSNGNTHTNSEASAKAEADAKAKSNGNTHTNSEASAKAEADAKAKANGNTHADSEAKAKAEADAKAEAGARTLVTAKAVSEAGASAHASAGASANVSVKVYVDAHGQYAAELWSKDAKTGKTVKCGTIDKAGQTVTWKNAQYTLKADGSIVSATANGKKVTHQLTRSEANAASKAQVAAKAKSRGSAVVPTGKQVSQVPTGSVAAGYEQPADNGGSSLMGVGAAAAASAAGLGFVLKRRIGAGQAG